MKSKITEAVKPEYLAGSDADKQQLADVLLALTDTDGDALYTERDLCTVGKSGGEGGTGGPEDRTRMHGCGDDQMPIKCQPSGDHPVTLCHP